MSKQDLPTHIDIGAWVDGELTGAAAAAMRRQALADPAVADQAQHIRQIDNLVRQAVPEDAVPAALLARLGLEAASHDSKIVHLAAARAARQPMVAAASSQSRRWPMMRIAAQVVLVSALGFLLATWQLTGRPSGHPAEAAYRTLSNGAAPIAANGVIMFANGVDAAAAHAIAEAAGGQLVGAPNQAGAWKLLLPAGRRDAALAALRADRRVALAQPLDGPQP